jgi:apolipoprotein D and lipocalin family protein
MKNRLSFFLCAVLVGVFTLFAGCVSGPPEGLGPLETVDSVDVEEYLGRWYEIARFPHGFEKNIVGAMAEYSLREDGKIKVVNSGYRNSLDGEFVQVEAVAWVPDPAKPGALKVEFFPFIAADYLIFGLDQENYQWALVGNDSRKFLWLLSRRPEISDGLYDEMVDIAAEHGFEVENLEMVPQKPRE